MRPTWLEFGLSILLLISGVVVVASGVAGIIGDVAAATPGRWLSSAGGRPPEAAWWLRTCLADSWCRESASALFASSLAGHGRAVWGGMLAIVASAAWLGHLRRRSSRPRRSVGGARFASRAELRHLTRSPGAWFPLGYARRRPLSHRVCPGGGLISTLATAWAQPVRLPEEDLARHVLVLGLTGAHKTTSVVFPVLLEAAGAGVSVVALDLKYGEEDSLARAAGEWQRWGRDVLIFAPLEPGTLRWNPLDRCRTMGAAHQVAAELFDEPDPTDPDLVYWLGAERHVCAVLCFALSADGGAPSLGRLRALCESGPGGVQAYVRDHPAAPALLSRLGAYGAMLPKDQAGILQGIAARLEAWGDEAVCAATGPAAPWERIDLQRVRREPVLLVVGIPQAALGRLRWLCRLFLRNLAANLLRPRAADERVRVLLMLEELPAWGAFPALADQLATYRSRQVSVLATLQSEAQGEHVYGRIGWAAVAANLVTKLYLPALADTDAERLSRVLGLAAGEDVSWSRGWGPAGTQKAEHRRAIPIPLEGPAALRGTGTSPDEVLVRFARLPPARLWCPPYHLRLEYRDRVSERSITTADLAVYHHLRTIGAGPSDSRPRSPAEPLPTANPPVTTPDAEPHPNAVGECGGGESLPLRSPPADDGLHASRSAPDDVRQLNRLIDALVRRAACDAECAVNAVRRSGRIVEVRVRPDVLIALCRDADAMHALARRWSALRWVRRVRPTFVLSRRALDALDPGVLQGLTEICGRDRVSVSPQSPPNAG